MKDSGLQFEIQTLFMIENVDQYSHNHGTAHYPSGNTATLHLVDFFFLEKSSEAFKN